MDAAATTALRPRLAGSLAASSALPLLRFPRGGWRSPRNPRAVNCGPRVFRMFQFSTVNSSGGAGRRSHQYIVNNHCCRCERTSSNTWRLVPNGRHTKFLDHQPLSSVYLSIVHLSINQSVNYIVEMLTRNVFFDNMLER